MTQSSSGPIGSQRSIGLWIVLTIVTLGIAAFVWTFKTHEEIQKHSGQGVGGWVGVLIYAVFAPVTFFLVPVEIGRMYTQAGEASPVSWKVGLWFPLPLPGDFIWFVKSQGRTSRVGSETRDSSRGRWTPTGPPRWSGGGLLAPHALKVARGRLRTAVRSVDASWWAT